MQHTLLTTLVEEKLIMRYLNSIDPSEYVTAQSLLTRCLGYGILTAILPFYEPEKQSSIVEIIAIADATTQRRWLAQQPPEVKISIKETVERVFLSLS